MTPSSLRLHFRLNKVCSLFDLTTRFNADPEQVRDMLQIWIRKGKLCCKKKTSQCGSSCSKCHPHVTEIYEWVE